MSRVVVEPPNKPALKAASKAIQRWASVDDLVSKALRRTGYGGDSYGITYPGDQDGLDALNEPIPEGFVRVDAFEMEWDLEEGWYLELLVHACLKEGMGERAKLLEQFREDPRIATSLVEADSAECNKRWRLLVPYLLKYGWTVEGEMVVSPNANRKINAHFYDGDLRVLLRQSEQAVADAKLSPETREAYVYDHQSMVEALQEFFANEGKADSFR